ncbi:hypothetical protein [Cupriavidus sp. UGS-1]|uniref:hypothetical protein n=1 Tax=Cupriavidus sp. UGS-1 TaxID=2899826 RepID=UPI001E4497C7|nr:hypothetical protein [Cupriavidus sp. UGS-1]MCD9124016.1 hypothetical protein [Cupriavidus sp. UGS-1]
MKNARCLVRCSYCNHRLLPEEAYYYGHSCDRCEEVANRVLLDGDRASFRDRYWFYRWYLHCDPIAAAFMALVGLLHRRE